MTWSAAHNAYTYLPGSNTNVSIRTMICNASYFCAYIDCYEREMRRSFRTVKVEGQLPSDVIEAKARSPSGLSGF
jgi:hypothetical protein